MSQSIVYPLNIEVNQKSLDKTQNEIEKENKHGTPSMDEDRKIIWEKFYTNYSRSFWFYIYKICGNEQMADDVFQDSFFKFTKTKINFQNEKHMQAYLYRIAYRVIIDKMRRIKVENKAFEEEQRTYRGHIQQECAQSDMQFSMDMEKQFKKLKPKERMLLWLAYVEGYSHEEIAAMTEYKVNSLKVKLFRAREKLAKVIKGTTV